MIPVCYGVIEWLSVIQKRKRKRENVGALRQEKEFDIVWATQPNDVLEIRRGINDPLKNALAILSMAFVILLPIVISDFIPSDWNLAEIAIFCPTFPSIICLTATWGLFGGALGTLLLGVSERMLLVLHFGNDQMSRTLSTGFFQIFQAMCVVVVYCISTVLVAKDEAFSEVEKSTQQQAQKMTTIVLELKSAKDKAELGSARKSKFIAIMDSRECLIALKCSTRFLLSIVNDVLYLGQLESGSMKLDIRPERLHDRLPKTIFRPLIENARLKSVAFEYVISDSVPVVLKLDMLRLEQCIHNLGSNALKFTKPGGRVLIHIFAREAEESKLPLPPRNTPPFRARAASAPDRLESSSSNLFASLDERTHQHGDLHQEIATELSIVVADTGIGIPTSALPNLFKPYSQATVSTAREFGGTGLGLSITSMIVEAMNGRIAVVSEEGKGTTFTVTLPVRSCDLLEPNQTSEQQQHHPFSSKSKFDLQQMINENQLPEFFHEVTPFAQITSDQSRQVNGIHKRHGHIADDSMKPEFIPGEVAETREEEQPLFRIVSEHGPDTPLSILVVDDEPLNRKILVRMLQKILPTTSTIHEAADGSEAVVLCSKMRFSSSSFAFTTNSQPSPSPDLQLPHQHQSSGWTSNSFSSALQSNSKTTHHRTTSQTDANVNTNTNAFQLIFMDIGMPGMDGWTAIKALRDMGLMSPIVVTSGNKEDLTKCQEYRVDECLQKPFTSEAVARILAKYCGI
ncbi:hypothetical protein HK102_008791 [Quaeritorhiza haematococci]|nr:hypothetical protein HK102_008791 [Quaeritorhiza haematococci]